MRGIAQRLHPLAQRLARDLGALIEDRIEAMVLQVERAFDVALSAAADELAQGGG